MFGKTGLSIIKTLFLAFSFSAAGCNPVTVGMAPRAMEGNLDLTGWDFQRQGPLPLDGEWWFYWQQLVTPADLANGSITGTPRRQILPSAWSDGTGDGGRLPGLGAGTYRLHLKFPDTRQALALKIPQISHAWRLYLDGRLLATGGKPGLTEAETIPARISPVVFFQPEGPEADLLIQVADFYEAKGGIRWSLHLGLASQISTAAQVKQGVDFTIFGAVLIMALYHFGLFGFRRSDPSALWFALFCLSWAVRILFSGDFPITGFWTNIDFFFQLKTELVSLVTTVILGTLFVSRLYPDRFTQRLFYVLHGIFAAAGVIFLFFPGWFAIPTLLIFFSLTLASILYLTVKIALITLKGNRGALVFLSGLTCLLVGAAHDILVSSSVLTDGSWSWAHIGFFLFIFSQAWILSTRFSQAVTSVDSLSRRITDLDQEKLEAETANRAKSSFVAAVSHDLRTPIHAILGFGQMLLRPETGPLNDRQKRFVENLGESSLQLLRLIDSLLDLAKLEAGKIILDKQVLHLAPFLDGVLRLVAPLAEKHQLTLVREGTHRDIRLEADEIRLRQILVNLFSNAIQFTKPGRRIGLEVSTSGTQLFLTVWDEGIGIAKADHQRIFERFEQVRSKAERPGGSGLGLSITRELVELHGGSITVNSEPGHGAEFLVTLPCLPADTDSPTSPKIHQPRLNGVLMVEDNRLAGEMLKAAFDLLGVSVVWATTGQAALEEAGRRDFALAVIDLGLPDMEGEEVARLLRPLLPAASQIVGISASFTAGQRERLKQAGLDLLLAKPLSPEALVPVLRSLGLPHRPPRPGPLPIQDRELARLFFRDCHTEYLEQLEQAVQSGQAAPLRKAAHKLRSALAPLGFDDCLDLAILLEDRAQAGQTTENWQPFLALKQALEQRRLDFFALEC